MSKPTELRRSAERFFAKHIEPSLRGANTAEETIEHLRLAYINGATEPVSGPPAAQPAHSGRVPASRQPSEPDVAKKLVRGVELGQDDAELLRSMRDQTDPRLNATLKQAVRRGWPMAVLGRALGVSRQAIEHRISNARGEAVLIPDPPQPVPPPPPKAEPTISEEDAAELRALQQVAARVGGFTPPNSPARAASRQLDELIDMHRRAGFRLSRLARETGISESTLRFRSARYRRRRLAEIGRWLCLLLTSTCLSQDCRLYYCPTVGEVECPQHGGFDVCCARPGLHQPATSLPNTKRAKRAGDRDLPC